MSKLDDLLPLTSTVFHMLVALADGARHGYSMAQEVEELTELGLPVVVVDDGSTDGSLERLEDVPLTILRHPENRGKGAALLTAAEHIREAGGTHMICSPFPFQSPGLFWAKISSRLGPVMVSPWFLRPTAVAAGRSERSSSRTTASASSRVPQG